MSLAQISSKKLALGAVAIAALLVTSPLIANALSIHTSTYDFNITDPEEPVVNYAVNGNFINHQILIQVNMSSQDGVSHLNGKADIILLVYNDTLGDYQSFQTLASGKVLSLTPTPTVMNFSFTTSQPGEYRVQVNFTTTDYQLA